MNNTSDTNANQFRIKRAHLIFIPFYFLTIFSSLHWKHETKSYIIRILYRIYINIFWRIVSVCCIMCNQFSYWKSGWFFVSFLKKKILYYCWYIYFCILSSAHYMHFQSIHFLLIFSVLFLSLIETSYSQIYDYDGIILSELVNILQFYLFNFLLLFLFFLVYWKLLMS